MNVWYAKAVFLIANIALIAIRAPHGQRSRSVKISTNRKGALETVLLYVVVIGFFVPLVWVVSPWFAFAEYPLRLEPFIAGVVFYLIGLWLFYRSHADLGTNWSVTLQVRENHTLITNGIYRRIRHPMYTSLFLFCIGQALVIPNWFAGPVYLVTFLILFALRVAAEERMMRERFGDEYVQYMQRTQRLVPWLW